MQANPARGRGQLLPGGCVPCSASVCVCVCVFLFYLGNLSFLFSLCPFQAASVKVRVPVKTPCDLLNVLQVHLSPQVKGKGENRSYGCGEVRETPRFITSSLSLAGSGTPQMWAVGSVQLRRGESSWRVGSDPWEALCHCPLVHTLPGTC